MRVSFIWRVFVLAVVFGASIGIVGQGGTQVLPPEIPREKTLIIQYLFSPSPVPGNWNLWAGWRAQNGGLHQFVTEALWTLNPNVVEGGIINGLAAEPPKYNEDFTELTIKLREGIYWSDGVQCTAQDLAFTILAIRDNPGLEFHGLLQDVAEVLTPDDFTVVVKLKKPNSRFHTYFVERWNAIRPMPKHIFEKAEDIVSFPFHPPVSLGPYVYVDHDPAGYWVLWKKRDDWQRTVAGKVFGEPKPEYVLFINYGPPEKQVMAMLRHELDVCQGTAEQMITLLERSNTTRSYRKHWPYIDPRDISTRGPGFNCLVFPYNLRDVRWALALAINIDEVLIASYNGMAAVTFALPLVVSPTFYEWYFKPLRPWLEELTLDLGNGQSFKPWDPDVPFRMLEWAQKQGYEVHIDPNNEDTVRLALGYGWWKYAPDAAEALLKKHGFSRGPDGKWRLPDGSPWKITVLSGPDPTDMGYITALAVVEQWKKFGIDAELFPNAAHATLALNGEYQVYATSHGGWAGEPWGLHPDLYRCFNALRSDFVRPIGEATLGWSGRWSDPRIDQIVAELEATPWENQKRIIELGLEGLKITIEEMIAIPLMNCPIAIVFDEYYWTNFPSPENDYARCDVFTTWPEFKYVLHHPEPVKR